MTIAEYLKEKEFFIFELDNVIYPEKDYLLQVYYLFAQFIEYGEQLDAIAILKYMQDTYLEHGEEEVFEKTAAKFAIPVKYKVNMDMLLHSARLPLKLLIYDEVSALLQAIVLERKHLFLFVQGNPTTQLNKIKQVDWKGLEQYLTVFFTAEFEPEIDALKLIMEQYQPDRTKALLIGNTTFAETSSSVNCVDYLNVNELFMI